MRLNFILYVVLLWSCIVEAKNFDNTPQDIIRALEERISKQTNDEITNEEERLSDKIQNEKTELQIFKIVDDAQLRNLNLEFDNLKKDIENQNEEIQKVKNQLSRVDNPYLSKSQ